MNYKIYQVDAFTDKLFFGNPACVVPLEKWLPDEILLNIAKENAVSETAFFIRRKNEIHLRWFTPDLEIDLCGHATLATAHVLRSVLEYPLEKIRFKTLSGELIVTHNDDFYYLDFPSRKAEAALLPKEISLSLNIQPKEVFKSRDYMLVYQDETQVRDLSIDRAFFDQINLGVGGVIVTAIGSSTDFVSRYFTPQATILEDPVTGSAHCTLIPFWSSRLLKQDLEAAQISARGGRLLCKDMSSRVIIGGQARTFFIGSFRL